MARRNPELMDRVELGERMLNWHGGQDDPVYAVGSFYIGNKIYPDPEVIEDALANLEMELSDSERMLSGEKVMVRRQGRQVDLRTFAGYSDKQLEENIEDLSEIVDALREQMAEDEGIEREDFTENRRWTRAYINSLPDSHFFYIERSKADYKDREGRSHPLNVRHFPYKDRSGRVNVAHVKDALGRIPQSRVSAHAKAEARRKAERVYEQHGGYQSNARHGWVLADRDLIFGYRNGEQRLLPRTKRGLPSGTMVYDTKNAALTELQTMIDLGEWFLWTPKARAVQI